MVGLIIGFTLQIAQHIFYPPEAGNILPPSAVTISTTGTDENKQQIY